MMGEVKIASVDIGPSYLVSNRQAFVEAALRFNWREDGQTIENYFDPLIESARNVRAGLVDNEIRVYGIPEGIDSIYVTAIATIETDPEKIWTYKENQHPRWRVVVGKLIDITSNDLDRGYVNLPLITENLTLNYLAFLEGDTHERYITNIIEDFQDKEGRLSRLHLLDDGRYSKGL
ncbi:MAG: hypothetical protein ACQEV6_01460 [Pseudomonadota bacterium]